MTTDEECRAERTCNVESSHVEREIGDYSYLEVELSCGHAFTWDDGTPPDYCPYCGARIIREGTGDPGDTSLSCRDIVACDRDALLELTDEMEGDARYWLDRPYDHLGSQDVLGYAYRVREACGEVVE